MTVILIGATGTIGAAVHDTLSTNHEVIGVGRTSGDVQADLSDPNSIQALYEEVGTFDAVVSAAGNAAFNTLEELTDEDFELSLSSKLMGQVNLVRHGLSRINADDNPSFTLVTGILAENPIPGSAAISMVNGGVEGFMRGAALEAPDGIRVNAVSPPWVSETLEEMGEDPSDGLPAATVAEAFMDSVEGTMTGEVIDARDYA